MFRDPLNRHNDKVFDKNDINYKAIYTSCFPIVRSMVLKNSGSLDDAKDVFQEALIVLFQQSELDTFKLNVSNCTYLYSVARNKWLKMLKRKFNHSSLDEDETIKDTVALADDDEFKQKQRMLVKYISSMGDRCQQIISLYFEGVSGEVIANKLQFSTYDYYRVAKNRCIENLKKRIQEDPLFKELIQIK
jgi:RNA polymerase sigma factor (sigma-70 family)